LVLELQYTYNSKSVTDFPVIYNTYQCYLKDASRRLRADLERSKRYDYHFGAKLVRGAYMESERALAASLGLPSPIHETKANTDACYNDAVKFLLGQSTKSDSNVEFMCATHNQDTIEKAIHIMGELNIDPQDRTISFAQLYGMMDNLTYNLGKHGFRAFKYVPYGEVKMVMPYLLRRANENSSLSGGARKELRMISRELRRRLLRFGFSMP
jgi:proline dehydrogenase